MLPQFCPIFNVGEMNLDHNFVQVSKLSEDQKKMFSPKMEHFSQIKVKTKFKKKVFTNNGKLFFPNSSGNLRSDAHQSQIIGGMQM